MYVTCTIPISFKHYINIMDTCPDDILLCIFHFFDPDTLHTISLVCKRFWALATCNYVWNDILYQEFGVRVRVTGKNTKQIYAKWKHIKTTGMHQLCLLSKEGMKYGPFSSYLPLGWQRRLETLVSPNTTPDTLAWLLSIEGGSTAMLYLVDRLGDNYYHNTEDLYPFLEHSLLWIAACIALVNPGSIILVYGTDAKSIGHLLIEEIIVSSVIKLMKVSSTYRKRKRTRVEESHTMELWNGSTIHFPGTYCKNYHRTYKLGDTRKCFLLFNGENLDGERQTKLKRAIEHKHRIMWIQSDPPRSLLNFIQEAGGTLVYMPDAELLECGHVWKEPFSDREWDSGGTSDDESDV